MSVKIVFIGPSGQGGINSVLHKYKQFRGWQQGDWELIETEPGASVRAARVLCRGICKLVRQPSESTIIHIHTASQVSFYRKLCFVAICLMKRLPYVMHVHGGGFSDFLNRSLFARLLATYTMKRAAAILTVTEQQARYLRALTNCSNVAMLPNPVRIPADGVREQSEPVILFVGRFSEEKGLDLLLTAYAQLTQSVPDASLVLAGDGQSESIKKCLGRHPNAESITALGWIDEQRLCQLYRKAAVLCMPSRVEGMPMAALEAMAHGLPVVAAAVGGLPELITDGRDGVLCPPNDHQALADALTRILTDEKLSAAMSAHARRRAVECYSCESVETRLLGLYRQIAAV